MANWVRMLMRMLMTNDNGNKMSIPWVEVMERQRSKNDQELDA